MAVGAEECGYVGGSAGGEAVGARGHAGGRVRWMGCWLLRAIAVSDFAAGAGARSVGEVAGVSAV